MAKHKKKPSKPLAPVLCPYCGNPAELRDSSCIYGKSFGMIWLCAPCDAYVGCHKNSRRHAPLGRLANRELRLWKQRAHEAFDILWQRKIEKEGCSKSDARNTGYAWLAAQLGIDMKDCHIGMFDVDLCRKAVDVCGKYR